MKIIKSLVVVVLFIASGLVEAEESQYPKSARREREENYGSVLGGEGGITLFGGDNPNAVFGKGSGARLNVNQHLWKATLDALGFMPFASVDSNSGVIVTDWYENPSYPGERYKVNVMITGTELRVEALKLTVFKQVLRGDNWREVPVNNKIATDLEEKILTRARALKVSKE